MDEVLSEEIVKKNNEMGRNIPGGNFPGEGFSRGSLVGGNFPGGNFPRTVNYIVIIKSITRCVIKR